MTAAQAHEAFDLMLATHEKKEAMHEWYEERAAIREYHGNLTRWDAEDLAFDDTMVKYGR